MSRLVKFGNLLLAILREIFDEAAYARFLCRSQIQSSPEAYAAFCCEKEARPALTKCC